MKNFMKFVAFVFILTPAMMLLRTNIAFAQENIVATVAQNVSPPPIPETPSLDHEQGIQKAFAFKMQKERGSFPNELMDCSVITPETWSLWIGLGFPPPFNGDGTLLVTGLCDPRHKHELSVALGIPNNPDVLAYRGGYVKNPETGEYEAIAFECSGAEPITGWCQGLAYLPLMKAYWINIRKKYDPVLVYAFVCQVNRDTRLLECPSYWQEQGVGTDLQPYQMYGRRF